MIGIYAITYQSNHRLKYESDTSCVCVLYGNSTSKTLLHFYPYPTVLFLQCDTRADLVQICDLKPWQWVLQRYRDPSPPQTVCQR